MNMNSASFHDADYLKQHRFIVFFQHSQKANVCLLAKTNLVRPLRSLYSCGFQDPVDLKEVELILFNKNVILSTLLQ